VFPVELCPEVMRHFGLVEGRRLMETWFSRNPATAPYYSAPPVTISLDWVLKFGRAKDVYDQLIKDVIWLNDASLIEIGRMLQRKGLLQATTETRFGELWRPVTEQDDDYINQRAVIGYQGVDDLGAALGAFDFRLVVAGSVSPIRKYYGNDVSFSLRHEVLIEEIGVYVRDSYDFDGDQFLGWWTYPDNYEYWRLDTFDTGRSSRRYPYGYVLGMPFEGGELITNEDFKKFRKQSHKGGDFLVYSELKRHYVLGSFKTDDLFKRYGDDVFMPTTRDMFNKLIKTMGGTPS
jgi:Family of unknown function (DUF6402)